MKSALVFVTCTLFVFQQLHGQQTIYDTVHFDVTRSHLNWITLKALDQISTRNFQDSDQTVVVCDGASGLESNRESLNWRRVNNVRNYLIAIGVDSTMIQIQGLCNDILYEESSLILICYDEPLTSTLLANNSKGNPIK